MNAENPGADHPAAAAPASTSDLTPLAAEPSVPEVGRRQKAARGAVVNSAFFAGLGALNLLKAFVVAIFLDQDAFGIWSILFLAAAFVGAIKAVIVTDKYIQQDEPDQEIAFQKAFSLELISSGVMAGAMLLLAPLLTIAYGEPKLLLPGLAFALLLPALALQFPISVWYRRMDFVRQRTLMSIDPIVGFAVTVPLAALGLEYWSLLLGVIAGSWAGAAAALATSPYPFAFRFDRQMIGRYLAFSWPLIIAVGSGLLIAQLSVYFGELSLGLAGAGAIGLAATYSAYADRVDAIITQALYPAICRVADRRELMVEAFVKSNRLTLMWGFPFGVALTLFAPDLVDFVIGREWADAIVLLQVFGLAAAVNHIGFNWSAFFRARGETRPIAKVTVVALAAFLCVTLPLLLEFGLDGYSIGVGVMAILALVTRFYYVSRLFPGFRLMFHVSRAVAPTVPAALAVLAVRAQVGDRTAGDAVLELGVYTAATILATLLFERPLLIEALSYLRRSQQPRTVTEAP